MERSGRVLAIPSAFADEDTQSAALLYRDVVEYAVGHGVAAEWDPVTRYVCGSASRLAWLPEATVKGMSATAHPMLEAFLLDHPEALQASWLART